MSNFIFRVLKTLTQEFRAHFLYGHLYKSTREENKANK